MKLLQPARLLARRLRIERAALSPSRRPFRHVFHHVPKCAGTTAKLAFRFWFVLVDDFHPWWGVEDNTAEYREWLERRPDLSRLRAAELLVGHWTGHESHLHVRHPAVLSDPRFRAITFLRDPLEARVSFLHYMRRMDRREGKATPEEWLLAQDNPLCNAMGIDPDECEAALDRYWYVGIAENLGETFARLRAHLGAGPTWIGHLNASKRDGGEIPRSLAEEFRRRSAGDYRLYAHALRRFERWGGLVSGPSRPG